MNSLTDNKIILPSDFLALLKESIGNKNADILAERVINQNSIASVRFNPYKCNLDFASIFGDNLSSQVLWADNAYYLNERPRFTSDPFFQSGFYYVQEASSMYMNIVRRSIEKCEKDFFNQSLIALDLCAAPGGKTTHLSTLLNNSSLLVANEVIKQRSTILADNVAKWGVPNIVVTNNDPADFSKLNNTFHLVVVDAPCSGEGLFGKDPSAIEQWSLANVNLCAQRQRRILSDIWSVLRNGGFLVYSTCTYNHFENDDNLQFILNELGGEIVDIDLLGGCGIEKTKSGGAQFIPGLVKGEGQFLSIVRKKGDIKNLYTPLKYKEPKTKLKTNIKIPQLDSIFNYSLLGDMLKGYPIQIEKEIKFIEQNLRSVHSGLAIANIKGKDYIPHSDFALWSGINQIIENMPFNINIINVTLEQAQKFLTKDVLSFANAPKGFLLLVYNNAPLGFVKNLGNRVNNLLPQARRIIKL